VLWLDGAGEVATDAGGRVSRWKDRSPAGNDAIQPSGGNQPRLAPRSLNALATITFGQSTFLRVTDHPTLQWGTGDFVVLLVAGGANPAPQVGALFKKQMPTQPYTGPGLFLNPLRPMPSTRMAAQLRPAADYALSSADGLNNGQFRVMAIRRNGGIYLELRLDGAQAGVKLVPADLDVSVPGNDIYMGSHGDAPELYNLEGGIAEVIAVRGTVLDADLTRLESYLKSKYALR
jgi:hypothetical protein